MGNLTVTPVFVDYSSGLAWSTLGINQTAAQAAVTQVCTDLSSASGGLGTWGADRTHTVYCGLSAVGNGSVDTVGTPVTGAASAHFRLNTSYATMRSTLQGFSPLNSDQSAAWNALPASDPFSSSVIQAEASLLAAMDINNNNSIGCSGVQSGFATDYDQHGTSASGGSWYGVWMHEITEGLGRDLDQGINIGSANLICDYFAWEGAGTRYVLNTHAHWFSSDSGTTHIEDLNATGAGDAGDANGSNPADAFNYQGPNTVAVSRSNSVPLFTFNWRVMGLFGWRLTIPNGYNWAGLSIGPTGPVGTMQFRR